MSTIDTIKADMKTAMKEKNKEKLSTLRMIISEANSIAMDDKKNPRKDPTEDDVLLALTRGVKQREDSVAEYLKYDRVEQAAIEKYEAGVYRSYLPEQLSDEDVAKLVDEVIAETNATSKKQMGMVMGKLMPKVKGKCDGKLVSKLVSQKLN